MKFFAVSVVAASVLPSILALTVNTPSGLITCEPTLLAWSGGTAPYYLSIIPGGETSGSALKSFDSTNSTSYTWTVDIAADTKITVELKDSTGTIAYSDEVDITAGSSTSCVTTSTAASGAAGSTGSSSSSTASTSSSNSSGASRSAVSYGLVALAGLIGAALL
ncbi:hypothetical protein BT96DRAFT_971098 [Gymnopus androsaceus JB14]|uniref:Uncharacterized protein n=1 Tax=Gymnopus androsaceus JB14 TaxID=1447944 RepID=A0A6A4IAW2_9AGAR|nr:hypothetical protein BT96DRAFT_971098 [Gymnopus androsaceus JB14]